VTAFFQFLHESISSDQNNFWTTKNENSPVQVQDDQDMKEHSFSPTPANRLFGKIRDSTTA
jgi:hypothetical protein